MTNETEVEAASQYVERKYAKLDLLVNCAAMLHPSGRGETSLKEVSSQVEYFVLLKWYYPRVNRRPLVLFQ